MAAQVKRLLFAAFLLVPVFSDAQTLDAQTLAPDATPKAFLQMIDRPLGALTPGQIKQREVNGIEHWHFTYAADEAQRDLLALAAQCLGVATAGDLADYFWLDLRTARLRLAELMGLMDEFPRMFEIVEPKRAVVS